MLALGPFVAGARSAPGAHHVAGLIEHDHRRRRATALAPRRVLLRTKLAIAQRARTLHDPDVPALVDSDAGDLAENPVIRERLRPERVHLQLRCRVSSRARPELAPRVRDQRPTTIHVTQQYLPRRLEHRAVMLAHRIAIGATLDPVPP